jgi:hypothetical protein
MEGRRNVRRRLNFDDAENTETPSGPSEGLGSEHLNSIEGELRMDLEAATLRWNFDFENEVPLEGRWQWEQVEPPELPRATRRQEEHQPEK